MFFPTLYLGEIKFQLICANKTSQIADEIFFGVWIASEPALRLLQMILMHLMNVETSKHVIHKPWIGGASSSPHSQIEEWCSGICTQFWETQETRWCKYAWRYLSRLCSRPWTRAGTCRIHKRHQSRCGRCRAEQTRRGRRRSFNENTKKITWQAIIETKYEVCD